MSSRRQADVDKISRAWFMKDGLWKIQMNQCNLSKYTSISFSITAGPGICMVCNSHIGPLGEPDEASPGIVELFVGACVPRFSYMFMARDIVDLLAPNCWVSIEPVSCRVNGETRSGDIWAEPADRLAASGTAEVVRGRRATLTMPPPSSPGPLLALRRLGVNPATGRGWHSIPERTHVVHGLLSSHCTIG